MIATTTIFIGGAALGFGGVLSRAVFSPRSQLLGPLTWRGANEGSPRLAITFDDGPDPIATPRVLDLLAELDAKATFFVTGRHVAQAPDIVRRIHADGHVIGNHSFDHANFGSFRFTQYWNDQICRTDDVIGHITGVRPALFRPPMGIKTPHIMRAARLNGHAVITWTRRSRDGVTTTSQRIVNRLQDSIRSGDIVLFHDGAAPRFRSNADAMIASLRPLILHWRELGLSIVPLNELIGASATQQRHMRQNEAIVDLASTRTKTFI